MTSVPLRQSLRSFSYSTTPWQKCLEGDSEPFLPLGTSSKMLGLYVSARSSITSSNSSRQVTGLRRMVWYVETDKRIDSRPEGKKSFLFFFVYLLKIIELNSLRYCALLEASSGGRLVIRGIALYSNESSSNPAEVYCKILLDRNENEQKKAGVGLFIERKNTDYVKIEDPVYYCEYLR